MQQPSFVVAVSRCARDEARKHESDAI
jgi:hypothetical protein